MEPYERTWVRLPLQGAVNVRELGGYPTANGGQIQYRRFLRGDAIFGLTRADERLLYEYGVRAVIDLRGDAEAEAMPDCAIGPDVVHMRASLLEFNAADIEAIEERFDYGNITILDLYRIIVENYEKVRACFRFIAEAPAGCVLFHCSIGKDRTGILAMLLMGLAGADKWDAVGNYVQSFPNLMRDEAYAEEYLRQGRARLRPGLESRPDAIEYVWDLIEHDYGGVEGYLLSCGVPDEDVAAVYRRLTCA